MIKEISAVEWLYNQSRNLKVKAELTNMNSTDFIIAELKLLQEAKQMEKEQIKDAFAHGKYNTVTYNTSEEYYKDFYEQS